MMFKTVVAMLPGAVGHANGVGEGVAEDRAAAEEEE